MPSLLTLKPYRYRLPLMAVLLSIVLIALNNVVDTKNLLGAFVDELNLPASLMLQVLPGCCFQGHDVFGYHTWLIQMLFLSLVGFWWYLVGLELDFSLLRYLAGRWFVVQIFWITLAVAFQIMAIYILAVGITEMIRNPIHQIVNYFWSGFFLLMVMGWLELIAIRFWQARRKPDSHVAVLVRSM